MSTVKIQRINSELVKTISKILLRETRDDFLKSITITGAEVSKDLSYAKVYFTSFLSKEKKELEKEMEEASDMIRKFVAEQMDLRQTPKLKFLYDESIEYGSKIEHILEEIHQKQNK